MVLPLVGWVLPRQLAIKKKLHRRSQSDGGKSSIEVPPSQGWLSEEDCLTFAPWASCPVASELPCCAWLLLLIPLLIWELAISRLPLLTEDQWLSRNCPVFSTLLELLRHPGWWTECPAPQVWDTCYFNVSWLSNFFIYIHVYHIHVIYVCFIYV